MTIDQDRCRSATHSLQQSHVDNVVLNYVATKYVVLNCSFAALDECVQGQLDSVAAHFNDLNF